MHGKRALCSLMLMLLLLLGCSDNTPEVSESSTQITLRGELGGSAEGFERACEPREFHFPEDHGAHPSFRNEWWYVTGNVDSTESVKFGFHATFFRIANRPEDGSGVDTDTVKSTSNWAASQFYMAHFAISEAGSDAIRAHERFARAAAGLAGAETMPLRVWLDDWALYQITPVAAEDSNNDEGGDVQDELIWHLQLAEGTEKIDLTLRAKKPLVLQGRDGLSQKSSEACNASYYYSASRLEAAGTLVSNGQIHHVRGGAWLDREWSSSALGANQVGWDWFALQFSDGRELMYYQLRNDDGNRDSSSYAVEIDAKGAKNIIPVDQLTLNIDRWWQSSSGSKYPVAGQLIRADTGEVIVFTPLIDNQEMTTTLRYWEGAIALSDPQGQPLGSGYLELTGY